MRKVIPYLLTAPLIVLLLIWSLGIVNAVLQGLGYIPALGLEEISFQYYRDIIRNPDFMDSLLLSLRISFVSSFFSIIIGILICVAIIKTGQDKGIGYQIVRIPILIPHTIVALFVIVMLSQSGILSRLLFHIGVINVPMDFPNMIYNEYGIGVILGYVWKQAPFVAYFTLALMASISKTLEEAAINLGASPIKAFFAITLPLSLPAIANAALIITTFSFGAYELPFLLGVTKPKAIPVQAYVEYTHPDLLYRPYAMAANGTMIIITFIIAVLFFILIQKTLRNLTRTYEK